MLNTESITFSYDGEHEFRFPDLQLAQGENMLILGESGVGKTTMIQILAGLLRPQSGSLKLNSKSYHDLSSKDLDQFRGKHIGMVFQRPHFVRNLSILDNLLLSLYLSKNKQEKSRAIHLLEQIGLGDKWNNKADQLSQGEQQRAAIALAVIKNPDLILADEPTGNLDPETAEGILRLLHDLAANGRCVLMATHNHGILSRHPGRILQCGNGRLEELQTAPQLAE